MRALLLLLLGSVLVAFAWYSFRGEEAPPEEVPAPPPAGQLRPVAPVPAPAPRGEAAASPTEVVQDRPAKPEPAGARENEPAEAPAADGGMPLDLAGLGDPLREGSLLLHEPGRVPEYLKGPGRELSEPRKQLLMAYALLVTGRDGLVPKYAEGLEGAADVTTEEFELLREALSGSAGRARSASHPARRNPLVLGVTMALMARQGLAELKAQRCKEAAETFSELILAELDAPWAADRPMLREWSERLHEAQASHRWRKDGSWPAIDVEVRDGDHLVAIRKRVLADHRDLKICTGLIERSNQLGKYLREGNVLRVPTARVHVVIDLSARWLLYLHGEEVVCAWEIAIGTPEKPTAPGHYTVGEKTPEPTWFPPGRAPVAYGDPENCLGTRWIALTGSDGLGVHGTWEPESIGDAVSDGCIRLRNDHVEALFEILPRDSEVVIRP